MREIIEVNRGSFFFLKFDALNSDLGVLILQVVGVTQFIIHTIDAAFLLRFVFLASDDLFKAKVSIVAFIHHLVQLFWFRKGCAVSNFNGFKDFSTDPSLELGD